MASDATCTDFGASEQKHAIAAMSTAPAAMEVASISRPPAGHSREHYAATIIQTSFRGYLVSVKTKIYHLTILIN